MLLLLEEASFSTFRGIAGPLLFKSYHSITCIPSANNSAMTSDRGPS